MKVLLAYDGFSYSRYAREETAKLVNGAPLEITVLSVVPPDARASKSGGHVGMAPHAQEDVALAHKYLSERGIESELKIAHGRPADEILAEAGGGDYDLIVVGSRGLGSLGSVLLGSVSRKVVREAPCAVLVAAEKGSERHEPARSRAPGSH